MAASISFIMLICGISSEASFITSALLYFIAISAASLIFARASSKFLLLYRSLPIDRITPGMAFLQLATTSFPSAPQASANERALLKLSSAFVLSPMAKASAPLL